MKAQGNENIFIDRNHHLFHMDIELFGYSDFIPIFAFLQAQRIYAFFFKKLTQLTKSNLFILTTYFFKQYTTIVARFQTLLHNLLKRQGNKKDKIEPIKHLNRFCVCFKVLATVTVQAGFGLEFV